ncbi:MAG: nucleotide sugar dehydrogenase [Chloroflexi bacterium]|nr:nucleotide sugar dehydrogenase [Chloroflexota bacterium]
MGTGEGKTVSLSQKIQSRDARVAVVGLGYVGLPLAVALGGGGFAVTGVDVDVGRVEAIRSRRSYIPDVSSVELGKLVSQGRLDATTDYRKIGAADVIFICVPTPFTPAKAPDISFIAAACQSIAPHLHREQLVILQSTTYPGTTEEEVRPILETSGLVAGRDFYLAFSPERINPGDKENTIYNTPKVVGGLTDESTAMARLILSTINPQVHVVSSPRVAEMCKLLENIFRSVNIALVNELAKLCERMNIDLWEVIQAASTKPFGFMPFYPGPGVGGHCIPVDPYYLSWKAREYDFYTRFIELAADVNQSMPYHVVEMVREAINSRGKPLQGCRLLVLGVAFKRDIDDPRNSPAERVIDLLLRGGAVVSYHDPYVPRFIIRRNTPLGGGALTLESMPLQDETIAGTDAVVIITGHRTLDYQHIVSVAPLVVDCCNAFDQGVAPLGKVWRLGAPRP